MSYPNTLVIAGHDPSGGAGIQADIEAVAACGGHAATVVSALTCQDTVNVYDVVATETSFVADCLARLDADMTFAAIKTGVLANPAQVEAVANAVTARPDCPLVVDPVLVAAGGGRLADSAVAKALVETLLPRAVLATPNAREARALCDDEPDLAVCGPRLARLCGHILITGGDEPTGAQVSNRLYDAQGLIRTFEWPRLAGTFHGSGCTLASTIAALLAAGHPLETAVADGQARTAQALTRAFHAGRGQAIPNRLPR